MDSFRRPLLIAFVAGALLATACGDDDTAASDRGSGRPTVVVSTTALGDVVESLSGGQFDVVTVMSIGSDPHDFQASAKQANEMREADALIVNGAGLEEGLIDVIESADRDGVPTFEAISAIETIEFGAGAHDREDEHDDEHDDQHDDQHDDEDHESGGEDHDHEGVDPHFFLEPTRMADAARGIGDFLTETLDGIDRDALESAVSGYVDELDALDAEIEELLAEIEPERRVLVTNHDAFGYFAERYDLEVVGTVIPSGSSADGSSGGVLAELADVVRDQGVPAIFSESTVSDDLAQVLADEVGGDVEVVELFTESLSESGSGAGTYLEMIRTNARRIADALA